MAPSGRGIFGCCYAGVRRALGYRQLADEAATHPLTQVEMTLIEDTWAQVASLGAQEVGVILFKQIFTIAPQALQLFSFKDEADLYESPNLKKHALGVVKAVGLAVGALRELEKLVPMLQGLGRKHVDYGVLPEHYDVVGQALIKTLSLGLGHQFTKDVELVWTKLWGVIASTMQGDNYKRGPAPPSHPLQAEEMSIIETTWELAASLGKQEVGVLLFRQIFDIAPGALQLFPFKDEPDIYESPKLKKHALGVVNAVGKAVASLRDLDTLVPLLQDLGRKHVGYGVKLEHYDVVGQALLKTLSLGLGDKFSKGVEASWTKLWGVIAVTMQGDNYKKDA